MSDRHFDLNASIAQASAEDDGGEDPWVTFDLNPNYLQPRVDDDDHRSEDERRAPWRVNVRDLPGWLIMEFLTAQTVVQSMRSSRLVIEAAIDPDQWQQFHAVLVDPRSRVVMSVIDDLMNRLVRAQLGLPLDR